MKWIIFQELEEEKQKVSCLQVEVQTVQDACRRQEKHYTLCVKQLQQAASQMQELLAIKDKVSFLTTDFEHDIPFFLLA